MQQPKYSWARRLKSGYEVSSKGDKRFSALFAKMPDGRSIEMHYQCDVKGYQPGGRDWRLGKGKPPLRKDIDLFQEYLKLWQSWSQSNQELLLELKVLLTTHDYTLTDMFATTDVNQAHALSVILNTLLEKNN